MCSIQLVVFCLVLSAVTGCGENTFSETFTADVLVHRSRRDSEGVFAREHCPPDEKYPSTRRNTSDQLRRLREQLLTLELDGFLVPSTDAHQSEYVAEHDKRRAWLSGFTGSNGFAVVTSTSAALWTDGRYYLQAEDQLDCNWILMRADEPDTPDWWDWLEEDSKSDGLEKEFQLGADPALTAADDWLQWKENLSKKNIVLKSIIDNPIDKIWVEKGKRTPSEVAVHQLRLAEYILSSTMFT